jgi:hypothetical protein
MPTIAQKYTSSTQSQKDAKKKGSTCVAWRCVVWCRVWKCVWCEEGWRNAWVGWSRYPPSEGGQS